MRRWGGGEEVGVGVGIEMPLLTSPTTDLVADHVKPSNI